MVTAAIEALPPKNKFHESNTIQNTCRFFGHRSSDSSKKIKHTEFCLRALHGYSFAGPAAVVLPCCEAISYRRPLVLRTFFYLLPIKGVLRGKASKLSRGCKGGVLADIHKVRSNSRSNNVRGECIFFELLHLNVFECLIL